MDFVAEKRLLCLVNSCQILFYLSKVIDFHVISRLNFLLIFFHRFETAESWLLLN
jgi:hypothetical protein